MTTKNPQDVVAEMVKELDSLMRTAVENQDTGAVYAFEKAKDVVRSVDLTQLVKEVEAGVYEKAIKLSDEIERAEPDGGTRQWMAFKRFRNTLRDRLTPPTSDVIEK